MKIEITIEIDDEYTDAEHGMGLTEEGYNLVMDALSSLGSNIDVRKALREEN